MTIELFIKIALMIIASLAGFYMKTISSDINNLRLEIKNLKQEMQSKEVYGVEIKHILNAIDDLKKQFEKLEEKINGGK